MGAASSGGTSVFTPCLALVSDKSYDADGGCVQFIDEDDATTSDVGNQLFDEPAHSSSDQRVECAKMLTAIFNRFDANLDGLLNLEEINTLKLSLGVPELSMDDYRKACKIYGADFAKGWTQQQLQRDVGDNLARVYDVIFREHQELLLQIFKRFDEDRDGYLCLDEINGMKGSLGLPDLQYETYCQACKIYGADPNKGWNPEQLRRDLGSNLVMVHERVFKSSHGPERRLGRGTPTTEERLLQHKGSIGDLNEVGTVVSQQKSLEAAPAKKARAASQLPAIVSNLQARIDAAAALPLKPFPPSADNSTVEGSEKSTNSLSPRKRISTTWTMPNIDEEHDEE